MNWEEEMRRLKRVLMDWWDEVVDVYSEMCAYIDELENELEKRR